MIYKSCQLGKLNSDMDNCKRPALPDKHYGIRICAKHLKLLNAIRADAIKAGTIGVQPATPKKHPHRRAAA